MGISRATRIHDDLHVRALVLDNGKARIGIALADLCVISHEPVAAARKRAGFPVLIAATHTHSGPATSHLFQALPDPAYVDALGNSIAEALSTAVKRLRPARVGVGVGREQGLVFNRRFFMREGTIPPDPFGRTRDRVRMNPGPGNPDILKPAGPIDPDVGVIAVEGLDGKPIAVLANYALHYVGGVSGGDISADYFGVWAESLARQAGVASTDFVPMLANACSGNINNIDVTKPRTQLPPYAKMQEVADTLARECLRVWRDVKYETAAELAASEAPVELATRLPDHADIAAARKLWDDAGSPREAKGLPQVYARETLIMARSYPRMVKTFVQAVRIGDTAIATFPGEAFVELGLELKKQSPFRLTLPIELANDYRGYIPTVEAHAQGGYETWRAKSSYLGVEAAPKLLAAALGRLRAIA
jgi:hypothetical protein